MRYLRYDEGRDSVAISLFLIQGDGIAYSEGPESGARIRSHGSAFEPFK
jgi:hypothetical protein